MSEFSLNNQVSIKNPHANVSKWWGPYSSIAEAKTETEAVRDLGFQVGVIENGYVVRYHWQKVEVGFDFVREQGDFTEQLVTSGGNYNDLEVTGDILVFTNDNAQAILNGVTGKKEFSILNYSDYELRINNSDLIYVPTPEGFIGVDGTCRMIYSNHIGKYLLFDVWNSKYDPAFPGLTEEEVITINQNGMRGSKPLIELKLWNYGRNIDYTTGDLNRDYPNAPRGTEVICPDPEVLKIYRKEKDEVEGWYEFPITKTL